MSYITIYVLVNSIIYNQNLQSKFLLILSITDFSSPGCVLLCVHSSFAIILMGKRELVALLYLSFWCLVIVVWLFLAVPWVCLQFVIAVFPDHTDYF